MSKRVERRQRVEEHGEQVSEDLKSQVAHARAWLEAERPRYVRTVEAANADLDAWDGRDEGDLPSAAAPERRRGEADA